MFVVLFIVIFFYFAIPSVTLGMLGQLDLEHPVVVLDSILTFWIDLFQAIFPSINR